MSKEFILISVSIVIIIAGFVYYQHVNNPSRQNLPVAKEQPTPEEKGALLTVNISLADTIEPAEVSVLINDKNMVKYSEPLLLKAGDKFSVAPGLIVYRDSNFTTNISGDCEGIAEVGGKYICYVSTHRVGSGLYE
jgi:hypothetical protein